MGPSAHGNADPPKERWGFGLMSKTADVKAAVHYFSDLAKRKLRFREAK